MEEVIHEIKIVETDDGYRIEIKGDKQRIKRILDNMPFGMGMPFGFQFGARGRPGHRRGQGHHHEHHARSRHHRAGRRIWKFKHGRGPWNWTSEDEEGDVPPHYDV